MTEPIALLGLGLMGRPMARTLITAGLSVRGWNRSALAPELTAGIPLCTTLAEAAEAEICILMLADPLAVGAVMDQLVPLLRRGQLLVDMGSSDPLASQLYAQRLALRGIGWVDAPVSGGPEGAAAGTLAIMAGGNPDDLDRVRSALEALGRVTRVGGPGAGHTTKAINQLIVGLAIEAVAEAVVLGEAFGIPHQLLREALAGGFADSKVLQIHGARMGERAYIPGGRAAIHLKDLRLAQRLAQEAGLQLPHLDESAARYARLVAQGDGDLDHSALHKLLLEEQRSLNLSD